MIPVLVVINVPLIKFAACPHNQSNVGETFGNPTSICSQESFKCVQIELWGFASPKFASTFNFTSVFHHRATTNNSNNNIGVPENLV